MKKLVYLGKNSFTIIETILSLIIVSIILSGFIQLLSSNNDFKTYTLLQKAQNDFVENNDNNNTYTNFKFKRQ